MAGGSGTRFWPRSRNVKPKQYLNLFGRESLLESTISRFGRFMDTGNIYIVSGKSQAEVLEQQTTMLPKENLIYEPVGKNTLPAIGLAAVLAEKENPDAIMVVSPSDHLVKDEALFRETVQAAARLANQKNGIVTIGITPSYPATGYGYIQAENELDADGKIKRYKVRRFVEKPDHDTAKAYLEKGGFYWNSGMFIFKISVFLEAVQNFAPQLYRDLKLIQADMGNPTFGETLDTIYRAVEGISVDYGIMEHAQNIYMVEGNFPWNDLGSWESVYLFSEKDENRNAGSGGNIIIDSRNSYVYSDEGLVALVGLDDVVVVREGNAVLVCKRENAENVKLVVDHLKRKDMNEFL